MGIRYFAVGVAARSNFLIPSVVFFSCRDQTVSQAHADYPSGMRRGLVHSAEWIGARFSDVLNAVGVLPQAKWVFFFTFDEWWDSLDIPDAMHPQTFLA